ncbi:2-hydroxy-6-oxononadienedioate/2-hydroxy-6-oxononatrienedioate hydrolase [Poriferisphaera corsica]|uniref:2-hydroxy-6-oxononadienedioate/2-hydroxy-6-oxononatrienedioate hydrolase n=1 Tax=Poriferisphaera corsica TaxID=2528020 RepID=A0A517YY68_9BACT|nr:alpha/beta hydrolase [Poriferisphaera corsica]QDU35149.1 2-hydroxy-6-oxononadienedioate/2-hydroxy-6-oxononatrienedioate hydrolase [Poriferisphaera corsica]
MITFRIHNQGGHHKKREIIVLHGGPAAAGSAAPIAQKLSQDGFTVIEPLQRDTDLLHPSEDPSKIFTVDQHVRDLHELIIAKCSVKPIILGESWGAMLALAYAARYPQIVGPLILVGCGTFSEDTRSVLRKTITDRIDQAPGLKDRFDSLESDIEDPHTRMQQHIKLIEKVYNYAKLPEAEIDGYAEHPIKLDAVAHKHTWCDMIRLQKEGMYPDAFKAITSPVLMIHGSHDPHPGIETYELLKQYMPQMDYHELERCGHSPWVERYARTEFFSRIRGWLALRK